MVEKWPLKTVETALCPQIPNQKLPVWTDLTNLNPRFKTNHSKTSIRSVPRIFGVLFRLICWESQAFLPIKRKSLRSVPELDCVITGLGQSYPSLNSAISHWSLSLRRGRPLSWVPMARFVNASTGSYKRWPESAWTLHERQSPAAWQTTQIFCCTLTLQRTLQRLGWSFSCLAS